MTPMPHDINAPSRQDTSGPGADVHRFFFTQALEMLCIAGFDGYFKELNPIWEQVLGYSQQELCAQPFVAFVHPDDRDATMAQAQQLVGSGSQSVGFENRYRCKDGSYRRLRWVVAADRAQSLFYAIAHDVTAEASSAAALRASEARFRQIALNIPGAVFQFTVREGVWTVDYMSERIKDIAGVSAAEIMQNIAVFTNCVHPDDQAACSATVAQAVEQITPWHYVGRFLLPDGSIRWWEGSSTPTQTDAGEIIFNGVVMDITTRRQAEEALQERMIQEEIIRAQQAALEELSTPLIPISDEVVVMPLIGAMDSRRAQQVMDTLLHGIAESHASTAILDITGVSVVDTQVANALVRASQAVKLLGAQVMLTGIRPEVAQTLVSLGVDLGSIITRSTLQSGIALALRKR